MELAVELTGIPRGCITLVDAERTTAKSSAGFPEGSPLYALIDESFCRFVVGSGRPLIVDDARQDPRTRNDPAIDLYDAGTWAGYPIEDIDGRTLGTFCLMDSNPHEWTATDLHVLATLAKAVSSEIALRRSQLELSAARQEIDGLRHDAARDHAVVVANLRELVASAQPRRGSERS
jgi:sigma-B regulation protein RsbU (phosphoserine phosphatase)